MALSLLVVVALIVIFVVAYSKRLLAWWHEKQRRAALVNEIPGPPTWPVFGTAWMFKWKMEELTVQMAEWATFFIEQKAEIIRVWIGPFPIIVAFSAECTKQILESTTQLTKGPEYDIMKRWLGTGLLTSTGDKWRTRRKMLTPAFHFSVLNGFLETHDKEAQIFVSELKNHADSGKTFDIFPYIKRSALDIICETSMGLKIDAQTHHNHPYVKAVRRMNELSFMYARMPWMWFPPIWYASGYGVQYDRTLRLVTDFTRHVIAERKKEFHGERKNISTDTDGDELKKKKRYAFLDLLLSVQDEGRLTDEDIREEVDTFMFEGHDTTSSGMAWTLWCLAHHPEFQEKVVQEVDAVFGKTDRPCTTDDLKELKYLEMCIKESMRLYPPVPMFTRRIEEDFRCVQYTIPKGSTVLIVPMVLHRNKNEYDHPERWDPENFSPERTVHRHPFSYIPFSAGPRNCIGQKFALMEEKTILSWFFRRYRISADVPMLENIAMPQIILTPAKGVPVKIVSRG